MQLTIKDFTSKMDLNTVLCTCVYLCDRIHVWWIPYLLQVHALQRSVHRLHHPRHRLGDLDKPK